MIAIAKALQRQIDHPGYDLSKIAVNAWAEALRNPDVHRQAYRFYNETHKTLAKFAKLWQSEGLVGADADAAAIADLFIALMPGDARDTSPLQTGYRGATDRRDRRVRRRRLISTAFPTFRCGVFSQSPRVERRMFASPSNRLRSRS